MFKTQFSCEKKTLARELVKTLRVTCAAAVIAAISGCATLPPPPPPLTTEEIVMQDNAKGLQLAPDFERKIKIKRDDDVSIYLRGMAERLASSRPELKNSPIGVLLIQDLAPGKWQNYSLPGNRIYVSTGLLKSLAYENEVAAAVALQLAHILRRDVVNRLNDTGALVGAPAGPDQDNPWTAPTPQSIQYFGVAGIFSYPEAAYLGAIDLAVELLYAAGIDSRGLVSLWSKYQSNPAKSPFERGVVDKLLDRTRKAIAGKAPLLNPIVRTDEFLKVQKRIQKL